MLVSNRASARSYSTQDGLSSIVLGGHQGCRPVKASSIDYLTQTAFVRLTMSEQILAERTALLVPWLFFGFCELLTVA